MKVEEIGTPYQPFVLYIKDNLVIDSLPDVLGGTISNMIITPLAGCDVMTFSQVRLVGAIMWGSNTSGWKITSPHWAKENPLFT